MCAFQPTQRTARPSRPTRPANLIAAIEEWWHSPKRRSTSSSSVGVSPSNPFTTSPDQTESWKQIRHLNDLGSKMGKDRLPRGGPREDGAGVSRDSVRRESSDVLRAQDVRSERRGFRALNGGSRSKTQGSLDSGNGHVAGSRKVRAGGKTSAVI